MSEKGKNTKNMLIPVTDPTFKPILIDDLEVKLLKEDERGKIYLLRNPKNSSYIKMHESVWKILKTCDGNKSIKDISQIIKNYKIPVDVHELLKMLAEEGFIQNIKVPKRKKKSGVFSFKIKLFTMNERYLSFLKKHFIFVKKRSFKIFYISFCVTGFALFIYNLPWIFSIITDVLNPKTSFLPLLLSFFSSIMFYIVEISHEFAHAVSYYHYGGKSSEIGIEFHFLIPFFYASTLDAIWMETHKQIIIFIIGPLTSLFFAEVFTFLFVFESTLRYIWAFHAFFWHISTLITLSPIIKTDGYFIFQAITKFPNLLEHGIDTLANAFQVAIGKTSYEEFKEHISQYSSHERKILKIYIPLFPILTSLLVFFFVVAGLQFGIIQVLNMTPQILMGTGIEFKVYVLWALYILSLTFGFVGIIGTLVNTFKKFKED